MDDSNPYAAPNELGMLPVPAEEQPESPLATRDERQWAFVVDLLAMCAIVGVADWLLTMVGIRSHLLYWCLILVTTLCLAFLYYYRTEFRTGKSPGKYVARLTVLSYSGGRPTQRQYLIRMLARLIPFDAFSAAELRREAMSYRDKLSGTVVVADKRWRGQATWLQEEGWAEN